MWEIYLLNKKETGFGVDASLLILYPKLDISKLSVTGRIEQYVIGLYTSGFMDFERVIKGVSQK